MGDDFDAVFLDTNIFLHFQQIEQIDWLELANTLSLELVVCMQVIRELDHHKSDPRLKDRASEAIKIIEKFLDPSREIRPNVVLRIFNFEARKEDFDPQLSPDQGDDVLLHLMKVYSREYPQKRLAVLSDDLGIRLRAKHVGINAQAMPEIYRRSSPIDEQAKKIRDLQLQNLELQNRRPVLKIELAGAIVNQRLDSNVDLKLTRYTTISDLDSEFKKIRNKFPHIQANSETQPGLNYLAKYLTEGVFDYDSYNSNLEDFYKRYKSFLDAAIFLEKHSAQLFKISVSLKNNGKGPAENVRSTIAFPSHVGLLELDGECENVLIAPTRPNPPKLRRMKSFLDQFAIKPLNLNKLPFMHDNFRSRLDPESVHSDLQKDDSECYSLVSSIMKTVHNRTYSLGELTGVFTKDFEFGPFELECKISTSDHPDLIIQKIIVFPQIVDDTTPLSERYETKQEDDDEEED